MRGVSQTGRQMSPSADRRLRDLFTVSVPDSQVGRARDGKASRRHGRKHLAPRRARALRDRAWTNVCGRKLGVRWGGGRRIRETGFLKGAGRQGRGAVRLLDRSRLRTCRRGRGDRLTRHDLVACPAAGRALPLEVRVRPGRSGHQSSIVPVISSTAQDRLGVWRDGQEPQDQDRGVSCHPATGCV